MASSSRFSVDATVRLHGLQARPSLNGQTGRIISFDAAAGRYAVRLLDDADHKPILDKPANLESVIDGAYDVRGAAALAEQKDSAGRQARLDALVELVKQQHTLKEEASEHTAVVAAAGSRNDLPDGVWDRVVEIMRIVQSTCNSCNAGFPTLLKEAIENNDALLWSRASVEYAYYLLGQSPTASLESPIEEAKRVARRVLRVHANHRCSDAMLAAAVMEADGPFARWSGEFEAAMSQASANERPEIDEDEWHAAKERIAMHESLEAAWDEDTHKRLAEKGASMAEEAERAVEKAQRRRLHHHHHHHHLLCRCLPSCRAAGRANTLNVALRTERSAHPMPLQCGTCRRRTHLLMCALSVKALYPVRNAWRLLGWPRPRGWMGIVRGSIGMRAITMTHGVMR